MPTTTHDESLFGLVLILALLFVVCPLSLVFGVDSRLDEVGRRRRFNA